MKKVLGILLTFIMVFVSGLNAFAANGTIQNTQTQTTVKFTDVDESTEEGKAIYKLASASVVNGNGDGTFGPKSGLTRAELCKMINLVFGYTQADTVQFNDVKPIDWFAPYVLVAKKAGYINGYEDGSFRGNNNITREEFCAILCRVANLYDLGLKAVINDKVSDWAYEYVNKVITNSLMYLEEGKTFRATENMKRGEIAVVLAGFVKVPAPITGGTVVSGGGGRRPSSGGGSSGGGSSSGGSSSGGSSSGGSSSGGSSDDSSDDEGNEDGEPVITPEEYKEMNKEIIEKLTKAKTSLSDNMNKFRGTERNIITNILDVVDKIIADADKYEISYDTVLENHTDAIADTYATYSEMPEISRSNFKTKVADIDEGTFEFLMKFFGISNDL